MKANELMIGDWVLFDHNPVRVAILGAAQDSLGLTVGDNVFGQPYSMIEPIPLTAEILEKNGWEYSEYTGDEMFTWPLDDDIEMPFRLVVDYNGNKYWITVGVGNYLTPINYVHELQHALRLCGIEKDITL